jgi:predicted ArsR family transcriptional regulator
VDRVTVSEAAERLGVTPDALRQRVRRGTIQHDKESDGRVYVYLDKSHTPPQNAHDDLVDALRDQVETLKTELADWKAEAQRKDTIIMSLTQRIPELEAPSEPRESPETPTEEAEEDVPAPEQGGPWWRRWFGG